MCRAEESAQSSATVIVHSTLTFKIEIETYTKSARPSFPDGGRKSAGNSDARVIAEASSSEDVPIENTTESCINIHNLDVSYRRTHALREIPV